MVSHRLLALLVEIPTGPLENDVIVIVLQDISWTNKELLVSRYGQSSFLQCVQTDVGPHTDPYENRRIFFEVSIDGASFLLTKGVLCQNFVDQYRAIPYVFMAPTGINVYFYPTGLQANCLGNSNLQHQLTVLLTSCNRPVIIMLRHHDIGQLRDI